MMNTFPTVMTLTDSHTCLHEEQLNGQSRAIERLSAELDYKKERLDDLKEDNRRMEQKIDNLNTVMTDFVATSNRNDSKLEVRLTSIEEKQNQSDKKFEKIDKKFDDLKEEHNKETTNKLTKYGLLISAISVAICILFNVIK